MSEANLFDLSQIRFDSDSIDVLSLSRSNPNVELPLTQGPINFEVVRSDGKVSNRWGADVNTKGDAYVYCRDNPEAEKVSLHASGRQHISIRSEVAERVGAETRFGNVWSEPEFGSSALATFSLIFPPWGVGLDLENVPRGIKKDELLIIGHKEMLVVVGFFVVDTERNLRGQMPHIALGRLALREGKTLHVMAWKEPRNDLIGRIRRILPQASQGLAKLGVGDGDYAMCVQGYRQPNSAYMVVFPVHYRSRAPESRTRSAVHKAGLRDGATRGIPYARPAPQRWLGSESNTTVSSDCRGG